MLRLLIRGGIFSLCYLLCFYNDVLEQSNAGSFRGHSVTRYEW